MAVISVKEHFKSRPARIKGAVRDYQRCWYVQTDSITDMGPVVMSAAALPRRFSSHPQDPGAIAIDIDADKLGESGYAWEVKIEYSSEIPSKVRQFMETAVPSGSQGSFPNTGNLNLHQSPVFRPPRISWGTVKYEEAVTYDRDGLLIVNSARLALSPSPTKVVSAKVLRIIRNEVWYDPHVATSYEDSLNSDEFWGYEAGLCKIDQITGEYKFEENLWFAEVAYEIHIREKIQVQFPNSSIQSFFPWDLNPLNAGLAERIVGQTNSDGSPRYRQIRDDFGNPLNESHPLASDGSKLAATATPTFLTFRIYPRQPFSNLGLPDPYA